MITTLLFDFSRVLLFAKDKTYKEDLNPLNKKLIEENPDYDFLKYFELNNELLNFLESAKNRFELYIFTSGSIQNNVAIKTELDRVFSNVFSAEEKGISKKEPGGYIEISRMINKEPSEILFVDDSQTNINAANEAGLNTFLYKDNASIITKINSI